MIEYLVGLLLAAFVITTPFVSQEGLRANQRKYDCGGAVASMIIEGVTGIQMSVDDLMKNLDDVYLTHAGIQSLVEPYEIELEDMWFNAPDVLRRYVRGYSPVLVLVRYEYLNASVDESATHWIIIIDADEFGFYYHDSYVGPRQYIDDQTLFMALDATDLQRVGMIIIEG